MITFIQGDATAPVGDNETKIIAHVCNNVGGWGRGFVLSLTKKWPAPERSYRSWYQMNSDTGFDELVPFRLGRMKLVQVGNNTYVANMIAQHGTLPDENGKQPIRYDALEDCFAELSLHAKQLNASIHMPRIGCGLAGGKWSEIEPIIDRMLVEHNVFVYDFDTNDARTVPWNK